MNTPVSIIDVIQLMLTPGLMISACILQLLVLVIAFFTAYETLKGHEIINLEVEIDN